MFAHRQNQFCVVYLFARLFYKKHLYKKHPYNKLEVQVGSENIRILVRLKFKKPAVFGYRKLSQFISIANSLEKKNEFVRIFENEITSKYRNIVCIFGHHSCSVFVFYRNVKNFDSLDALKFEKKISQKLSFRMFLSLSFMKRFFVFHSQSL